MLAPRSWIPIHFIVLLTCLPVGVPAQSATATLSGLILDQHGAAIPDVKITILNLATSLRRQTATDNEGYFTAPLLPPGLYTIAALREGFAPVEVRNIELSVNDQRAFEIILKLGTVAESVVVEASVAEVDANKIDITNATRKFVVANDQVRGMPVLNATVGRNPLNLLPFLAPGVSPITVTGTSVGANRSGIAMSVNGARPESNSFSIQGSDNNEPEFNRAISPLPNPDALHEFTILTSGYQADEGRSAGGIVNAVIKSGGNQWNANLRFFGIHEALNARRFFDREKPSDRLKTFGGQLSGPVTVPGFYRGRDRSFFFFDYEGTRSRQLRTYRFADVLTEKERKGDFSDLPVAKHPVDPLTGQPFAGGIIPSERIHPISRALLDQFVPKANDGLRGFLATAPTMLESDEFTARLDHYLGKSDSLNVTLFHNPARSVSFNQTLLPITLRRYVELTSLNALLSETHTFSARAINQFTASLSRRVTERDAKAPGLTGIAPKDFGFSGIRSQTEKYLSLPVVTLVGTSIRLNPTSGIEDSANTNWQLRDDLTYSRGSQTFKFGGDFRRYIFNTTQANNNGNFSFAGSPTARTRNAAADFLLGLPASFFQSTGATLYPRQSSLFLYGLNDWRLHSSLNLNLGLRYELATPFKDRLDQVTVFRPGQKSQRYPQAPAGMLFAGDLDPILGVVPRSGYPTDKNNFAPRIGLAFAPKSDAALVERALGEGKTAIRASWGVYYDATLGYAFTEIARYNQPFSTYYFLTGAEITAAGGSFANPYGRLPNPFPIDPAHHKFVGAPEVQSFDPNYRTAYTYQYNLTIQRELPGTMLLQMAYVGSNSFKQNRERDLNAALLSSHATLENLQERRLFPHLGAIPNQESTGRARYDSTQISLQRRFHNRLSFNFSYVLSKALDTGTLANLDYNPDTSRWGRTDYDRRHNFVLSYVWESPAIKRGGWTSLLLDNWQVGGITQIRSGMPIQIAQMWDPTLTTYNFGAPDLVGSYQRLNPRNEQLMVLDLPDTDGEEKRPVRGNFFFNPGAFRAVPIGNPARAPRSGTLGRNLFDGPGIHQWDLSVSKRLKFLEKQYVEFRADVSNLFNHAMFETPASIVDNSALDFGQVKRAGPGRTIQFSLRYGF